MSKLKLQNYWVFILSAISLLTIDLTSKYYFFHADIEQITIIKNFLYLSLQTNRGIAFGINLGYTFQLFASILILGILIYYGTKYFLAEKRNIFLNQMLLGIIIGGALGNLVNRIQLGYVIDFIALRPIPVFNIADFGITVGLILLSLLTYKTDN